MSILVTANAWKTFYHAIEVAKDRALQMLEMGLSQYIEGFCMGHICFKAFPDKPYYEICQNSRRYFRYASSLMEDTSVYEAMAILAIFNENH